MSSIWKYITTYLSFPFFVSSSTSSSLSSFRFAALSALKCFACDHKCIIIKTLPQCIKMQNHRQNLCNYLWCVSYCFSFVRGDSNFSWAAIFFSFSLAFFQISLCFCASPLCPCLLLLHCSWSSSSASWVASSSAAFLQHQSLTKEDTHLQNEYKYNTW